MKSKHPVRYDTTMRLERAVYANAARLFLDACTLYEAGAFPSAYALAILSFEEIGKVQMMDHVCFEAVLNDGSFRLTADRMEHLFSSKMFYSHRNKQAWGMYRGSTKGRQPIVEKLIDERNTLDRHKQDSVYVGFTSGRTRLPWRFRATHAHRQLHYVLGAFDNIADLPFYGVFQDSTRQTKREAKRICHELRKAFDALPSPRTKNA
jgi:AbiV family abortive infection protein